MAFSDVGSVIQAAGYIVQEIGCNWYKASAELDDFPVLLKTLQREEAQWTDLMMKAGVELGENSMIDELLNRARETLIDEQARLKKIQSSSCTKCWAYTARVVFPVEITESIRKVLQEFNNLGDLLAKKAEDRKRLVSYKLSRPWKLPFEKEKRYVPLEQTSLAVRQALETDGGSSRVVVLSGGPGTGKSSLARHLALVYEAGVLKSGQNESTPTSVSSLKGKRDANAFKDHWFKDGVFYVYCGPNVQLRPKILQLLLHIGALQHNLPAPDGVDAISCELRKLKDCLVKQSVLIVLDDVWEVKVLTSSGLVVPGVNLKYLVTSQRTGLWDDFVHIPIEEVDIVSARKILATQVGLSSGDIPEHLEDIADQMILKTHGNPLALTNLAMAITSKHREERDEWVDALEDLFENLERKFDRKEDLDSVASSMMVAVNCMPKNELEVLTLLAVCEGPGVPEIVMKLFFHCIHSGPETSLSRWRRCQRSLEDWSLIQVENQTFDWIPEGLKTWSIHGLRRHVLIEKRAKYVDSAIQSLVDLIPDMNSSDLTDHHLLAAFCILYGGEKLADEAARKLGITLDPDIAAVTKGAIEHFIWLLRVGSREESQQQIHISARQVILSYFYNGMVDYKGVASLLAVQEAAANTCWGLRKLCEVKRGILAEPEAGQMLEELLHLLAFKSSEPTLRMALRVLSAMSSDLKNAVILLKSTSVTDCVVNLLSEKSSAIQENAAWVLANLASRHQVKVANIPGATRALVGLLASDVNEWVHKEALWALANLTGYPGNAVKILHDYPRLLNTIVNLMQNHQLGQGHCSPKIEAQALRLLVNLATPPDNKITVVRCPGVLAILVGLLDEDRFYQARRKAAKTLSNLTFHLCENSMSVVQFPRALEKLGRIVVNDEEDKEVRERAANVVGNIAATAVDSRADLAKVEDILQGLAKLVENDEFRCVHFVSSRAITLIDAKEGMQLKLKSYEAYKGRGIAFVDLKLYRQALADFNMSLQLWDQAKSVLLSWRCFVKVQLEDLEGALADADKIVEAAPLAVRYRAERGVLRIIMGDYAGALLDLEKGLQLNSISKNQNTYEVLKHLAYVKHLMGDEVGAKIYAEQALTEARIHKPEPAKRHLCGARVKFLNYSLD